MNQSTRNAEATGSFARRRPYGRLPRAHYCAAGVSVDVTDLLNSDFTLVQVAKVALVHLAVHKNERAPEELLSYAAQVLASIVDLQTDRIFALVDRFSEQCASEDQHRGHVITDSNRSGGTPYAPLDQCVAFNRLGLRAQACDFASLKSGGRDGYSKMQADELVTVIGTERWIEMHSRLRAEGLLTPRMEVKVARWIARGLEVRLAVEKVKFDAHKA